MNIFKVIIAILVLYVGFLYYTRPEMQVTPDNFIQAAKENNLNVYRTNMTNANIAYSALNKTRQIKIEYANFNSNEQAHEYYLHFINHAEDKHSQNISRDVRIGKTTAEMQSYVEDDWYKIGLYAKSAVVTAKVPEGFKEQTNKIFDALYKPVKFDFSKIENYIPSK